MISGKEETEGKCPEKRRNKKNSLTKEEKKKACDNDT